MKESSDDSDNLDYNEQNNLNNNLYIKTKEIFELKKKEILDKDSENINKINTNNNNNNEDVFENKKDINKLTEKKSIKRKIKLYNLEHFFYYYMKLLYIFYLFASIIFFTHLVMLIIKSKCYFLSIHLWTTIFLAITMLYLGYIGVSHFNGIDNDKKYNHDNIFWFNFVVLVLTMISFIFLIKEHYLNNKQEKYIGIIIICFYLFTLLVEIIALLFFDLTNTIFDKTINEGYNLLDLDEENERLINI